MNKVKVFGAVLAAVVITAGTSQAMSENWAALSSRFLTLADQPNVGLPVGDLVELGIANNVSAIQNATSAAQAQAAFSVWASGAIGDGIGIAGAFTEATSSPGTGFFSSQAYLLVFNASTVGAATQVGLYTNAGWKFPVSDLADPNSLDLGDAGTVALRGALATGNITSPSDIAGSDSAALQAVPEPSTYVLVGTGLLGLIGIARRRRS